METFRDRAASRSGIAKRVLIIEKKQDHRQELQRVLKENGWDSCSVATIEDARLTVDTDPPYLHCIDTAFHDKEIRDYVRHLSKHDAAHTILVTSEEDAPDRVRALFKHGVYDMVKRPLSADELIPILERSFERAHLLQVNTMQEAELTALEHAIASVIFSTKRISRHLYLEEFCQALMHELAVLLEAAGGSLFILDNDKLVLAYSLDPGHAPDEISFPLPETSFLNLAYKAGKPLLAHEIKEEHRPPGSGFDGYKDQSFLILPLLHNGDDPVAFISLHNKKDSLFTHRDKTVGAAIASVSAALIRSLKSLKEVKESESRYQHFFETSLTANFIAQEDGRIILANPAFYKTFGLDFAENITFSRFFPNRDDWDTLIKRLKKEKKIDIFETELVKDDGSRCTVLGNLIANFTDKNMFASFSAALSDITEKRTLENELVHSQKMDAIGRLAGGVAHDFNNLITAILGYCEVLKDKTVDSEIMEDIEGIRSVGEKAASLTHQLLSFVSKQHQDSTIIDLCEIVRDLDRMLKRVIGEDIKIVCDVKAKKPLIRADRGKIEQVIMNLIVNARDAMPTGGTIYLTIEGKKINGHPENKKSGHYIVVSVRDTGTGMDREMQKHIFEPFYTTKGKGKGTGLGLSTVYAIVTQAEGHISVESDPGRGSTFSIYFPRTESKEREKSLPEKEKASCRGSEHILVVDDDKVVRSIIARVLKKHGYCIYEGENGKQALELVNTKHPPLSLAIVDMIMPSMSGVELASVLEKKYPGIRVLYMSGYTNNEIEKHGGKNLKKERIITKPFHQEILASRVREILDSQHSDKNR